MKINTIKYYTQVLILSIFILAVECSIPTFCKCTCGVNSKIFTLAEDATCIKCTKAACLIQFPELCDSEKSAASSSDTIGIKCFQRASYKDEIFIYIFLIVTLGLLLIAVFKNQLIKLYKRNFGYTTNYSTMGTH
ncbi:hypothetical protein CONCODRAFT_15164 [Conidiobolus coronatus NRRL 28638]|uniref:Membrane anchor Opy2 N-terminal domain-containing protein n=1 Tax=Conidiobolus coronatus (strain ATCC 28846 / CBS 209.66 / NRRL 28638) TaxID=796925 RepID=A0A137PG42_CONC2|nr:hypothetical protein CONCODRAFT_15164 [Conidiobolus coronatus NRRL 28638]|eukprot:KXN73973.1 hypothetical protein CONCODRAFT_15164 [Conidiobolus coronatus NRRL 28638]